MSVSSITIATSIGNSSCHVWHIHGDLEDHGEELKVVASMDPRLRQGIELFNKQEFFEAHEVLEDLWNAQQDPQKQLTQGIIQIAVGYYHLLRQNHMGARKLLKRGFERVEPFCPIDGQLDLNELKVAIPRDLATLDKPPENWHPVPPQIPVLDEP